MRTVPTTTVFTWHSFGRSVNYSFNTPSIWEMPKLAWDMWTSRWLPDGDGRDEPQTANVRMPGLAPVRSEGV